jgi:hypothetical protein
LNVAYASVGLAGVFRARLSQQAPQLVDIQSMFANDSAVQKQDGDIESVTALQGRIAIDVDYVDGWEGDGASESTELSQHLVAKITVVTMDDRQT